jgi:hypothetical protein
MFSDDAAEVPLAAMALHAQCSIIGLPVEGGDSPDSVDNGVLLCGPANRRLYGDSLG